MADYNIIDRFHQKLFQRLTEDISHRMVGLANGSAVKTTDDTVSTAEKYAAQTAYIQAQNAVLDLCRDIESDQYGTKPTE